MSHREYFYIYNINQANFYIENGIKPCAVGVGKKNETYIKFKNTNELQIVFTKWINNI